MPKRKRHERSTSRSENSKILGLLERMDKRIKLLENKNARVEKVYSSSSISSNSDSGDSYSDGASERFSREPNASNQDISCMEDLVHEDVNASTALESGQNPLELSHKPLQTDLLTVLGNDIIQEVPSGSPVQPEIVERWIYIVKNGLEETVRKELIDKYPPPQNGEVLGAPKLNPIIKQAIHDSVAKRDERLAKLQGQLAAGVSAIGQAMSKLLEKAEGGGEEVKEYIKLLSDAGRIITDVIHSESKSRRELVAYDLNKEWKNTLAESPIDAWLFGDDLDGRLKSAKELQMSSRQLKTVRNIPKQPILKQSRPQASTSLNFRGLSRYQSGARQGRQSTLEAPRNRQRHRRTADQAPRYQTKLLAQGEATPTSRRFRRQ